MDVHPEHGARFILRRTATEPAPCYDVQVLLPGDETASFTLSFADDTPRLEATGGPDVAPWIDRHLQGLARQLRSAARSDGAWPRRLRRWRAAPES